MDKQLKYLPIGSVVLLKGGTHEIMINGYFQVEKGQENKIYDYRGCPYPEGITEEKGIPLFNNDQIEKVVFTGYKDEQVDKFLEHIETLKANYDTKNGQGETL